MAILAKHAFEKFKTEMRLCTPLVAYGPSEVVVAAQYGAVEWLLVCGKPDTQLAAIVTRFGGKVVSYHQETDPVEFGLVRSFTGVCANLRFELPEDAEDDQDVNLVERVPSRRRSKTMTTATITTATKIPLEAILRAYSSLNGCASDSDSDSEFESDVTTASEDVIDEIESMKAIYPPQDDENDDADCTVTFHRLTLDQMCLLVVRVTSDGVSGAIAVRVVLPQHYPEQPLVIVMEAYEGALSVDATERIVSSALQVCKDLEGDPALFLLALHLQESLEQEVSNN